MANMFGVPGVNGRLRRRLRERVVRGRPEANEIVVLLRDFVSSASFPAVDTDQREAAPGGPISGAAGMYGGVEVSGMGIGITEDMTLNSIVAGELGAEKDLLKPGCMRTTFGCGSFRAPSACGKPWEFSGGGRRPKRLPSKLASDFAALRDLPLEGKDAERARVVVNFSGGEGAFLVGMYAGMS